MGRELGREEGRRGSLKYMRGKGEKRGRVKGTYPGGYILTP